MANTYKALQTVTVGSGGAAGITFSNIPPTYTDLVVKYSGRASSSSPDLSVTFNGSSSNLSDRVLFSYDGVLGSNAATSIRGTVNYSTQTANTFNNTDIYIPNYLGITAKPMSIDSVAESNSASNAFLYLTSGLLSSTTPITSLTITPNLGTFVQNTTATLYGVFNADISSAPSTPNIGTATDGGTGDSALITFTGVTNAAGYTMTSSPGGFTGTGNASPITVSGLTAETSYTFTCTASNPFGTSAPSSASNSVTIQPFGSYESIATNTLSSNANSVTFSSIPGTFKHLQLRAFARKSGSTGIADATITFNGDGGTNYTRSWTFTFDGDGPYTSRGTGSGGTSMGYFANNGSTSVFGSYIVDIVDYTNTSKFKTMQYLNGTEKTSAGNSNVLHGTGSWLNTAAITSITISCSDITAGSTFALYGIKG